MCRAPRDSLSSRGAAVYVGELEQGGKRDKNTMENGLGGSVTRLSFKIIPRSLLVSLQMIHLSPFCGSDCFLPFELGLK